MATRLTYAGARPEHPEPKPIPALELATRSCPPGKQVVVLATYTALLDIRKALAGGGAGRLMDWVA